MRPLLSLVLLLALPVSAGSAPQAATAPPAAPPVVAANPGPGSSAFPGQHAWAPADWIYPVWPSGCARFIGDDRAACLDWVAADFGRLSRYAAANALLGPPDPAAPRVVFFGDSITDGWSNPAAGAFFPGKPYVNRGIGGQTTTQMLLRFRDDVIALRPRVVVILAGTNDVAGNSGPTSPATIQGNLSSMAELAGLHGIKVVLASILPVADDKRDELGLPRVQTVRRPPAALLALNRWLAGYAREKGHVYLDYASAMTDASGALQTELNNDGLHPNAKGYEVMAPLAERAIAEALARR